MQCNGFVSSKAVKWYDFGLISADELLSAYQANLRSSIYSFSKLSVRSSKDLKACYFTLEVY